MSTETEEAIHMPTEELWAFSHESHEENLLSLNAPIAPPDMTTRTWSKLRQSYMKAKVDKDIGQQVTDVFEMIAYCKKLHGKIYYSKELHIEEIPELIQTLEKNPTLPHFSLASLLWEEIEREGQIGNGRATNELTEVFKANNSMTRMALRYGMPGLAYRYGRSGIVHLGYRTKDWEGEQEPIRVDALHLLVDVAKMLKEKGMNQLATNAIECADDFTRTETAFFEEVRAMKWSGDFSHSCSKSLAYTPYKKLKRIAAPTP